MKPMKANRSFVAYLVLGILTLGIYNIWFLHHLIKDINELCKDEDKKYQSPGILIYFLFSLLTCGLYSIFYWYRIGDMLEVNSRRRNCNITATRGVLLACFVINFFIHLIGGMIGMYFVITATNELAHHYNEQLTTVKTSAAEETTQA